jgi:hypothetical protein
VIASSGLMNAYKVLRCRLFRRADVERWQDTNNHDASWEERARLIAGAVEPRSRVIEFGAGTRKLEAYLDPACTYTPADLVERGPGTLVCDLNARPLPDLGHVQPDVAVFAGVLEYLLDLPAIPHWLARYVTTCVASYECAKSPPRTMKRIRESIARAGIGWVNTYSQDELDALFASAGFACVQTVIWQHPDGAEPIFVFRQKKGREKVE